MTIDVSNMRWESNEHTRVSFCKVAYSRSDGPPEMFQRMLLDAVEKCALWVLVGTAYVNCLIDFGLFNDLLT
jgi:hypothetical protein